MRRQIIYDLPMRFFHWFFVVLFITAFLIAKTVDDESPTYAYHMLAGLILGFIVILRIIWGFIGAKYSLFSNFAFSLKDLVSYFQGILSKDKPQWTGHNPASSWAALIMFVLALGLGVTGYLMVNGQKEAFEDIHELFANSFLVVVLMHIAGIILHSLIHRDGIALSMIDGRKTDVVQAEVIPSSRPVVALVFVGLVVTLALYFAQNFDSEKRELKLWGTTLHLGENEAHETE